MAQGKRTTEETKAKVTELKIQNTELSSHDIEKLLKGTEWEVSNDTVCDIINKLPQLATTERWAKQIERLDSIVSWIECITNELVISLRQKKEHTVGDVKTLNDIGKTNWERSQILKGKHTESRLVKVEEIVNLSDAELDEVLKAKLI